MLKAQKKTHQRNHPIRKDIKSLTLSNILRNVKGDTPISIYKQDVAIGAKLRFAIS